MAKKVYDIMLDETGDLAIVNGDLVIGESTLQHQRLLLLTAPAGFKQKPLLGVDVGSYINDDDSLDDFHSAIQQQFEKDGLKIASIVGKTVNSTIIKAEFK